MIDLNDIRKEFSDFLANSPGARWRMDAAFAHVVQFAYEKGVNEKSEREVELAEAFALLWVTSDRSTWDQKAVEHFDDLLGKSGVFK